MITAVDTSVLIDVFGADHVHGRRSADALRSALREGRVTVSDVVWPEVAAVFQGSSSAAAALADLGIEFEPISRATASAAGDAGRRHRSSGGPRDRLVADFLVGAHAQVQADRLLTRDRGFYRRYFEGLAVIDPADRGPRRSRTCGNLDRACRVGSMGR